MKFLITGANGFVGKPLCAELLRQGQSVRAAVRVADSPIENVAASASRRTLAADWIPASVSRYGAGHAGMTQEVAAVGSIDGATDWTAALRCVDVVIHLAARVHVMKDAVANPLAEFLKVNLDGTANLARQAASARVKRLVYVSSVKVNGECTLFPSTSPLNPLVKQLAIRLSPQAGKSLVIPQAGEEANEKGNLQSLGEGKRVFSESDKPHPQDSYGVSKWQAEQALHRVAAETGLEVVIVRPPLVYGAEVKGNFAQMLKILSKGIPLPLASVHNLRSLVYVENLVDALIVCATHSAAAGQTYLVSDGEDISTPDLLRQLGDAMGHPARLFPCPPALLKLAGRLTGKADQIERLMGSLQVDSGKIRRELGWAPPYTLEQGLRATADWYRATYH